MKKLPALLSKATNTAAQQARVLAMLEMRPHSSHEMHQLGIYHPPQRIKELRGMGCDAVQGYVYGKPMPPEEFLQYASAWAKSL